MGVAGRLSGTVSPFRAEQGTSLETPWPSFPLTSAGDQRELPRVPLRGEGCCGVSGASRDCAGVGAMEEGLISRGGRNLRLLSVSAPGGV